MCKLRAVFGIIGIGLLIKHIIASAKIFVSFVLTVSASLPRVTSRGLPNNFRTRFVTCYGLVNELVEAREERTRQRLIQKVV